jgi:hypothetical protein
VTADEALDLARTVAAAEGWAWQEPVRVRRQKSWIFFGPASWEVWTNAGSLGCNVRIVIDDGSRQVVVKRFLPR